jgi:hypothetical protein
MREGSRGMQQVVEVEIAGTGPGGRVEIFHSHILDLSNMDTNRRGE